MGAQFFNLPTDWEYRGEGNSHVVLRLPGAKKVISFKKVNRPSTLIAWIFTLLSQLLNWYYGKKQERGLEFYMKVMRPLLGFNYVSEARQVKISRNQFRELDNKLEAVRPDSRKHKIIQFGTATIFNDFAFLNDDYLPFKLANDTFSIELKPKQGWIPFSERNLPKCTFCLNQHLKLKRGQIAKIGKYCPEDLFSGDSQRMQDAIIALIENPQNNLKMFKNGQLCYSEKYGINNFETILKDMFQTCKTESSLQKSFCNLICKSLLTPFESRSSNCNVKLFCEWNNIVRKLNIQQNLPKGCVLEKILSAQMLDVEGTQYYKKLLQKDVHKWKYVENLLKVLHNYKKTCIKCSIMLMSSYDNEKCKKEDLVLAPYLISSVAKDCSLMITVKKILDNELDEFNLPSIIKTEHGHFLVNIGIVDLFPKPVTTITKHEKRNKLILDSYSTHIN